MFRTVLILTLGLALTASGCAEFQELSIAQRNRKAASGAWKTARWDYWQQGVPHKLREHIGRGFEQGYYDVASGGNGQVPLFPPNYYWGTRYQSPEGSAYIGAWFRGYQDGAMAAERDGLAMYNQIPTSWAPVMNGSANNTSGFPGLPPGAPYEGEVVPPIPAADVPAPIIPVVPPPPGTTLLPVVPEATTPSLVVPAPPAMTTPSAPLTTDVPAAAAPSTQAAPVVPATPEAKAAPKAEPKPVVPAPTTPRDPIGGKQTELLPTTPQPPVAQATLFGDAIELLE